MVAPNHGPQLQQHSPPLVVAFGRATVPTELDRSIQDIRFATTTKNNNESSSEQQLTADHPLIQLLVSAEEEEEEEMGQPSFSLRFWLADEELEPSGGGGGDHCRTETTLTAAASATSASATGRSSPPPSAAAAAVGIIASTRLFEIKNFCFLINDKMDLRGPLDCADIGGWRHRLCDAVNDVGQG